MVQDQSLDSDQSLAGQARFFFSLDLKYIKDTKSVFRMACPERLSSLDLEHAQTNPILRQFPPLQLKSC